MSTYTWKIESVNIDTGTMEVSYQVDDQVTTLNLPQPAAECSVADWIDMYAPRTLWAPSQIVVEVGSTGSGPIVQLMPEAAAPIEEVQNAVGSVDEEYIRALIYSVIEEIKEQSV